MRVIAGRLKGHQFDPPRGHRTHPMGDKVRGALFNALGDIEGLTVLDAYAGSGALAIEAVSRGASSVLAIDIDKAAHEAMTKSVEQLGLKDKITVLRKNIGGWSRQNQAQQFDLVLVDPPYDDINPRVLQRLTAHLKPGGVLVLSWPGNEPARQWSGLESIAHKPHGDAHLYFYRKLI